MVKRAKRLKPSLTYVRILNFWKWGRREEELRFEYVVTTLSMNECASSWQGSSGACRCRYHPGEVNIALAAAEKDLKRLGDTIVTKSSELAKVDEEVGKLENELKICEDYIASLQDEVAKAQQAEVAEGDNLE